MNARCNKVIVARPSCISWEMSRVGVVQDPKGQKSKFGLVSEHEQPKW